MKRFKKISLTISSWVFDAQQTVPRDSEKKLGCLRLMGTIGTFVVCLMVVFSALFCVSVALQGPPSDRFVQLKRKKAIGNSENNPSGIADIPVDKLLNGLLVPGFDEGSCLSRYQSASYRNDSPQMPSSYLISRLRSYEALHKRCGPYTESYNKTVKLLNSVHQTGTSEYCNYVVWISYSGLGNKMLTLGSAFLYALLTNRVLLLDRGVDMTDLFCEPFPNASWFLPADFPLKNQFASFGQETPQRYGNMLMDNRFANLDNKSELPSNYVYLHLVHNYDFHDKLFFCDQDQTPLRKIPWLIMKTNIYFVPALFLIPSFEQELNNLFPNKDLVFHFLGRYLFHPTNNVWGLITRYYRAYLANADEKIGIQIRLLFDVSTNPLQRVLDQILACTIKENLLPEINRQESIISNISELTPKSKAVLMTSLSWAFFEKIRDMYWEHPTVTGDVVRVFQPSHEEYQQSEKPTHDRKALAEMYLLSLTDVLVTSSWSTFGYVAQSLGGLRPWILYKPDQNRTVLDPPCRRAVSMEPCFHAPTFYDCKAKQGADGGKLVPHVRHCEDMSWGLKLVDHYDEM